MSNREHRKKYGPINREKHFNKFDIDTSVEKLLIIFRQTKNYSLRQSLTDFLTSFSEIINDPTRTIDDKLDDREFFKENFSNFYKYRDTPELINQPKLRALAVNLNNINHKVFRENFFKTVYRFAEFPMFTDKELNKLNDKLLDRIDRREIPILTLNNPYGNPCTESMEKDVNNFIDNILGFAEKSNVKPIKDFNILFSNALAKFHDMVDGKESVPNNLIEIVSFYQSMRKNFDFNKMILDAKKELPDYTILTKMSGCTLSDDPYLKDRFLDMGIAKITSPIGNFFYPSDNILKNVNNNNSHYAHEGINYHVMSYGKGDNYGSRVVGSIPPWYQRFMAVIAIPLKEQMQNLKCVATFNAEESYSKLIYMMSNGLGIDYSNYSDHLSKNSFKEIMILLGMNQDSINDIMSIFNLPIKGRDTLQSIPCGTVMGVMLDFFFITLANILMDSIAIIISERYDIIFIANGDDSVNITSSDNKELDDYCNIRLLVAMCFNCVVNYTKSEKLWIDNSVTFCKLSYNDDREPISGISGNLSLKRYNFITDINALIKQLDKSNLLCYFSDEEYNQMIDNMIILHEPYIKESLRRYEYSGTYEEFIENSRDTSISWGGLNLDKNLINSNALLSFLGLILNSNYDVKNDMSNFSSFCYQMQQMNSSIYERVVGKNVFCGFSISKMIQDLKNYIAAGYHDEDVLKELRYIFSEFLKYDQNESNGSVSVKNRNTVTTNADKGLYFMSESIEEDIELLQSMAHQDLDNILFQKQIGNRSADQRSESFGKYIRMMKIAKANKENFEVIDYKSSHAGSWKGLLIKTGPFKDRIYRYEIQTSYDYRGVNNNLYSYSEGLTQLDSVAAEFLSLNAEFYKLIRPEKDIILQLRSEIRDSVVGKIANDHSSKVLKSQFNKLLFKSMK